MHVCMNSNFIIFSFQFVDNKLTNEILKQARKQQEDLEEEVGISL